MDEDDDLWWWVAQDQEMWEAEQEDRSNDEPE